MLMSNVVMEITTGNPISNEDTLSLLEFCRRCALPVEQVLPFVEYGIIDPIEAQPAHIHWQFNNNHVLRAKAALRLQRDLEINLAGIALVLELLDEIKILKGVISED